MNVAVSFMGIGRMETGEYCWTPVDGEACQCRTAFFPVAVDHFFHPDRLYLLVTSQARAHANCAGVLQELGDKVTLVDIPDGKSEDEIWQVFDIMHDHLPPEANLTLDVTHALRSLPVTVFAAVLYLRRVKGIKLEHLVYGAWDMRDKDRQPPRIPVFDLKPLATFVDWLHGVEAFSRRGDADELADLLEQAHRQGWLFGAEGSSPRNLQKVGTQLRAFSQALRLLRPLEALKAAGQVSKLLEQTEAEAQRWAKPFAAILNEVRRDMADLRVDDEHRLDKACLSAQLALIEYCLARDLVVQAVLCAREWVINWLVLEWGQGSDWLKSGVRTQMEDILGQAISKLRKDMPAPVVKEGVPGDLQAWYAALPQASEITDNWDKLGKLRNGVAHCAMNRDAAKSQQVKQRAREIPAFLKRLLLTAGGNELWTKRVVIDLEQLYEDKADPVDLPVYIDQSVRMAGEGNEVLLTGRAPVWLYLALAHALHGKARKLFYSSPVTGEILVFDHEP